MNLEEDAVLPPTNQQLKELSQLVSYQLKLQDSIKSLADALKDANDKLNKVKLLALPEMMQGLGFDLLKTKDGHTVEIIRGIDASITQANQPKAFAWLKKKGHDSIIKTEFKLVYTGRQMSEIELARSVFATEDLPYAEKLGVHPGTLKAFVREELEAGHQLPDSITTYEYGIAKIS